MKLKFGFYDLFEGSDIDKRVLNWIFGIFLGIFAVILSFIIYFDWKRGDCSNSKEKFLLFEYHGKITRKYRSSNHGNWMVVFENGAKEGFFDYLVFEKIKPGDILIKRKNELDFKLVQGEDTLIFKEYIPDCDQFIVN